MANMNKKWYAWTKMPIGVTQDTKGIITSRKFIEVGEEVTPEKLKIKMDEFDNLIRIGTVRSSQYPKTQTYEAPKRAQMRQALEAQRLAESGGIIDDPDEDESDVDTDVLQEAV